MENWKKALLIGAATTGTVLLLRGQRTAGLVCAGVGFATLASEYPEKFAELRDNLHDYVERGTTFLDVVSKVGDRLAQVAEKRGTTWYEALLNT